MTEAMPKPGPGPETPAAVAPPGAVGVGVLLVASTLTVMAGATIAPALPSMAAAFADVPNAAFWVRLLVTVTALAIALTALPMGAISDRFGRVAVLTAGVLVYCLAGSAGLWLDSLTALLASRVVLGIAVAGIMTNASALIGDYFDGPARARMIGFQSAAMGFGGVAYLTAGGLLAEGGWRGPFLVYLAPAVLVLLAPAALPRPARAAPRQGEAGPVREPQPIRYTIYGAALLTMAAFYALPVQLPFLLAERGASDPALSGLALAGVTLCSAGASLAFGRLSRATNPWRLALAGSLGAALGLGLVGTMAEPWGAGLGLALVGAGLGTVMPALSTQLMQIAPAARRGRVMGGYTTSIFVGQFTSPLLLQPAVSTFGVAAAFLVAASLAIGAAALIHLAAARA